MDLELRALGDRNGVKDGVEARRFCSRRTYHEVRHVTGTMSGAREQTGG